MKTRIISGLIGIAILLGVVNLGGIVFSLTVLLITLVGLKEYKNAIESLKEQEIPNWINYLFALTLFGLVFFEKTNYIQMGIYSYILLLLLIFLFSKKSSLKDIALTVFGGFYVVFLIYHIYFFNDSKYIWYVFITSWGSDTFAYFTGKFLGKNKLWPEVSPNKTIEGSIGGLFGATLLAFLFAKYYIEDVEVSILVIVFVGAILSQMGDLIASKIKRLVGIKDYGNLMPGHGGVLDRFDSIIFISPFIYYMFKLLDIF